jgi:DNA helicase HerA-like ATPase
LISAAAGTQEGARRLPAQAEIEPMSDANGVLVAKGETSHHLLFSLANRHGLVAGATGTGKTVTLRVMAEGMSAAGVPVFMADVKGDLAGLAKPGTENPKFAERAKRLGVADYAIASQPVVFWDLFGEQGHPIRATVSEMGPLLLSRLLELNETQSAVLEIAFKFADDNGLLLDELKDLRDLLGFMSEHAKDIQQTYGNVAAATVGAIQRGLTTLSAQGGDGFFTQPAFEVEQDLLRVDGRGRGIIHVLAADKLMMRPRLYATFLLWLLSELFERLPEVGDVDKPKLVFFFDEAHLLFSDAPRALVEKVEQVVRLIRSKGVGVYFVTQNPLDIPESVLGQLGNRVQHALRAFTPKDQKAVKVAAETFRTNPKLDTAKAITELAVGEALVSFLDDKGTPGVVDRALVVPPRSFLGAIAPDERKKIITASPFAGKYDQIVQRESASEQLAAGKIGQRAEAAQAPQQGGGGLLDALGGIFGGGQATPAGRGRTARQPESMAASIAKSVARNVASQVGRDLGGAVLGKYGRTAGGAILRGVLGSILKR